MTTNTTANTPAQTPTPTSASTPAAVPTPAQIRKQRLLFIGAALALTAIAYGAWQMMGDDRVRSTDDAYVGGQMVAITPQVSGTVTRILADNADRVSAGAPLVEIDSSDARIELQMAQAQLAQAMRAVRALQASHARYQAETGLRQAELERARADLVERKAIADSGAVTREEVRHAAATVRVATAALEAARETGNQAWSQIEGVSVETHPTVQAAEQRVRAAELALRRTVVLAPVDGMVALRSVQLGRRVAPGERLMAVVPLQRLWIDANFKEIQLKDVCPGQAAIVTADVYGKTVRYHGQVRDIEAATGASAALLPPQNATGNWIKVVQRVPVRINIDSADLARNPLRIGMSAQVDVHTGACDGTAPPARAAQEDASAIYAAQSRPADPRALAGAP
jgi:membrane fusion protein (multidrug efflux system)